jgi:AraC-like DNA-binding protein
MRYKLLVILIFFSILSPQNKLSGQNAPKQQLLIAEAENVYKAQPNESLKIALLLLKSANSNNEKVRLNLLVYKIYSILGDYANAANYLFAASTYLDRNSFFQNAKVNIEKSALLQAIYLHKQSVNYLDRARSDRNSIKDVDTITEINVDILFEELELLLHKKEYKEAQKIIQKSNTSSFLQKGIANKKRFLLISSEVNIGLGNFASNTSNLKQLKELISLDDKYFDIQVWNVIARNYFYQRDYSKAIESALEAQKLLVQMDNIYLLETTTETLVLSYLALNKEQEYKLLNTKLLTIQNEIEKKEEEAINTVYNLINSEYVKNYTLKKSVFNNMLYLSIGFFILSLFVFGSFVYKKYLYKKRLTEIVSYLEFPNNTILNKSEEVDTVNKKNTIPAETEQLILNKLKKFETTKKFTNKEISLAVLAGQFETNTKYLSEIINRHYHINFNTYINTLRINYIVEKLKNEPNFCNYKISYLAEICGFSSHSSFATVFKSIIGISPIKFIDLLKNETNDNCLILSENE